MRALFLGALALVAVGCHTNPYCLNCKDSGNGVLAPIDMAGSGNNPGDDMMSQAPVDMTNLGGGCVPTNGGIEKCDGIDNDCNGVIDDVSGSALLDPNNCGACGRVCKYPNAAGVCMDSPTGPACSMGACQPGHVDLDKNPANGCEYVCAPSNNGVELCDKADNNCDGQVDEGFTDRWADAAHQIPLYDKDLGNCGVCGHLCNLPNAVMACVQPDDKNPQKGACVLTACFNGNVTDQSGTHHETYRHRIGDINQVGCDYHCPSPAVELNKDCNTAGACTFPKETCNGKDDDCDFTADDNLTDPSLNGRCPDGMPGKLCSDANNTCGGQCAAGTVACVTGALQCTNSKGPVAETCDGKDNDCDGKIDNGFTATWDNTGLPRYDSSAANCGACKTTCGLANAVNGCNLKAGDTLGSCYVVSCNSGWFYVTHKDANPAAPTCGVAISAPKDSTQTTPGIGCNYQCNVSPQAPETCDGKDNDCDGCIDNGITKPSNLCATKGVCAGQSPAVACKGASGWSCDYSGIPNVSLDSNGNLTLTEAQCDNLDNNCNGSCDENFPGVQVNGAGCTNPHAATTCKAGNGVCQGSGPITCQKSAPSKTYNDVQACSAVADTSKATDEKCNGKDDNCNGLIDEPTTAMVGSTTLQGWHDPVVQVAIPAYPTATLGTCTDSAAQCAAHTVYVYQYEASRPDALGTSPGSQATRSCSNLNVLPWANVTWAQAQSACSGIKDTNGNSIGRLCTAWEWQQTCDALAASGSHWSMSTTPTTYQSGVCSDANVTQQRCSGTGSCVKTCVSGVCSCSGDTDCNPGFACVGGSCTGNGAWPTGTTGPAGVGNLCSVTVGGATAFDMTGNLYEWTSTPVILRNGSSAKVSAVSSGVATITGLTGFQSTDVGAQLVLTGSSNSGNNGTFDIVGFVDATSVKISNANAVVNTTSNMTWQFVYRKVRGGAYSTSQSQGETCEFDFVIQRASFVNTDLGFRCCADSAP